MRGIICGWLKLSLTWRSVSVQPAPAENSPADKVVGMAIMRDAGRLDRGPLGRAVGGDARPEIVELFGRRDIIAEAQPDHLCRIGHRAAAQGDDQIGTCLARHIGGSDDIVARRMRADLGAEAGKAVAEHLPQPLDEIGLARQGAARQDEDGAGVEPVDLLRQRFDIRLAENDAFHLRKAIDAAQHRRTPSSQSPSPGSLRSPPSPAVAGEGGPSPKGLVGEGSRAPSFRLGGRRACGPRCFHADARRAASSGR